ncbi:MAG TPA: hypothetical protein VHF01_15400 [Candidatus Acidoferrum sp.]|nr:hypothetical protein [Candidatus Acidoferrum sp.]
MYLFAWIFVGVVVGWVAGKALKGNGYGPVMDIAMGIGGAVAGGFLMRSTDISGLGGTILTTLVAMVCAVLLTALAALANGRRVYARQL